MAGPPPAQVPKERKLPPLRKNLQFLRGAPTSEGVPTWTVVDPVRNKYFQIEWNVYQLLQRWPCGTIEKLAEEIAHNTTSRIGMEDVEDLVKFLYANNLTEQSAGGETKDYVQQEAARHQVWWQWLLHHYLFIKLPLVHPHQFLHATLPLVAPFYTAAAAWLFGTIGVVGLFLVGRQWDTFVSTFLHFFNWRGAVMYGAVLCLVKVVHELGHAYTATRFGCRVPTIGVAFMVMMPVLYSDVSDSYRLSSKRKRLAIAAAGVVAELGLTAIATVLWAFLPDGTLRSMALVVATSSWIMSLTVNLNPLMRFDGYYLLADGLGLPNLQDRACAFGQWKLRELLFGAGSPQPESVGLSTRRIMIAYAWAMWVYRLVLFTCIAVMVYHHFFKALGIVLFLVRSFFSSACPFGENSRHGGVDVRPSPRRADSPSRWLSWPCCLHSRASPGPVVWRFLGSYMRGRTRPCTLPPRAGLWRCRYVQASMCGKPIPCSSWKAPSWPKTRYLRRPRSINWTSGCNAKPGMPMIAPKDR